MYITQTGKGGKKKKGKNSQVFRNKLDLCYFILVVFLIYLFIASLSVRNRHLAGKLKTGMALMPGIQGENSQKSPNSQHRRSLFKNSQVPPAAEF